MKKTVEAYQSLVEGSRRRPFDECWAEVHDGRSYAVSRRTDLLAGPILARCEVGTGSDSVVWELHYGFSSDMWSLYRDGAFVSDVSPVVGSASPLGRVVALVREMEGEEGMK